MRACGRAGVLSLVSFSLTGQREREREREREKGREREFFKGMTGALAPFSYLVIYRKMADFIVG